MTTIMPVQSALSTGILLSFAFSQSIHYAVWLRLIPDEDHKQKSPRSFTKTYNTLKSEWGFPVLFSVFLLMIILAAWAFIDLESARFNYLQIFKFHAEIEISSLILLILLGPYLKMRNDND